MPSNKNFTPPRFNLGKKTTCKGHPFIQGDLRTFWGPGQRADAIIDYTPPTDWCPVGTPLNAPEVIWLGASFQDQVREFNSFDPTGVLYGFHEFVPHTFPVNNDIVEDIEPQPGDCVRSIFLWWGPGFGSIDDPVYGVVDLDPGGAYPHRLAYGPIKTYVQTVNETLYNAFGQSVSASTSFTMSPYPDCESDSGTVSGSDLLPSHTFNATAANPGPSTHDAMYAIFQEVKTRIESARPGKTFVNIIDWFIFVDPDDPENVPDPVTGIDPTQYSSPFPSIQDNMIAPIVMPDVNPMGPDFFPCKFLNIFVGQLNEILGLPTFPSSGTSSIYDIFPDAVERSEERWVAAYNLFPYIGLHLYGNDMHYGPVSGDAKYTPDLSHLDGAGLVGWNNSLDAFGVRGINRLHGFIETQAPAQMIVDQHDSAQLCADLSAYGAQYMGKGIPDADTLIAEIEAFFGWTL